MKRTTVTVIVSTAWLTTAIWWTFYRPCDTWAIPTMEPNAWGDWAAGTFAPLAFLWLVVGYFQQGEELRDNVRALHMQERALQLQVKELSESVKQQSAMAEAAAQHAATVSQGHSIALRAQLLPHQPRFADFARIRIAGTEDLGLRVTNDGAPCSNVRVTFQRPPDGVELVSDVGPWGTDGERLFQVDPGAEEFPLVRRVRISYEDALQIPQSQDFRVEFVKTGDHSVRVNAVRQNMTFNLPPSSSEAPA
jgi:hypothetical protein